MAGSPPFSCWRSGIRPPSSSSASRQTRSNKRRLGQRAGKGAALALPHCNTAGMALHLSEIAAVVSPGAHAALLLDQVSWHMLDKLPILSNLTLVPLPPKCPELNVIENVWQFIRDNWLFTGSSRRTKPSSVSSATHGTGSLMSCGESCPSGYATGQLGSGQQELVSVQVNTVPIVWNISRL